MTGKKRHAFVIPAVLLVIPAVPLVIPSVPLVIPAVLLVIPAVLLVIPEVPLVIPAEAGIQVTGRKGWIPAPHGGRGPGLCPGVHFRRTRPWI